MNNEWRERLVEREIERLSVYLDDPEFINFLLSFYARKLVQSREGNDWGISVLIQQWPTPPPDPERYAQIQKFFKELSRTMGK